METFVSICLGIGLSAACGFRVFVPLAVVSAASLGGFLDLSSGFQWMGTLPALIVFATATVVEVIAYYVPWLDNALDVVSGPVAVVAGTMIAASQFTELDPLFKWSLALIAGGGTAGLVKGTTTVTRGASTATTGGAANPLLATVELAGSLLTSFLALVAPVLAVLLLVVLLLYVLRRLIVWRRSIQVT
jgi:hypothetical protein